MFTQNVFYRFLSFWKILEIKYPDRLTSNASNYINQMISEDRIYLDKFITDLLTRNIDVGSHLYSDFTFAIAHITREPVKLSMYEDSFREVSGVCNSIENFIKFFMKNELNLPEHCININILELET